MRRPADQPVGSRLKRIAIVTAMAVVTLNIWTGAPLLGLWVGSLVAPDSGISMGALFLIGQQLLGDSLATVYEVTETSLVQASVTDRVLGRVNASIGTFTTLLTLAGAIAGGIIAETWGLRAAFWVGLAGAALTLLVVWFSPVRHVQSAPLVPTIDMPGDTLPITE